MDFGVSLGASNYLGEIGGNTGEAKPFPYGHEAKKKQTSFGWWVYRYNFTRSVAAKLTINYARISGADSLSNEPTRIARNLSFRTDLLEFSLLGEFTFFFNDMSRRSKSRVDFSTYVTAGVGILMYYPYAQHDGKWYYLRPLATEGIENVYDETAIVIPFWFRRKFYF